MTASQPISSRLANRVEQLRRQKGLGRLHAPDARDRGFALRASIPDHVANVDRYWPMTAGVLDQGDTSQCVAYSWTHFLLAAPTTHKVGALGNLTAFAQQLYDRAQAVDEWPGNDYEGTSARAGAKVLQADGRISEYRWAETSLTARDYVITRGPVLIGVPFYERMFVPDADGFLRPEGEVAGGHEMLILGNSVKRNAARILNSWGKAWGEKGRAWMSWDVLQRLLNEGGDCCSATECKPESEV